MGDSPQPLPSVEDLQAIYRDARNVQEIRVLLHDAEQFIDARHTSRSDDPDCPACGLVARLRSMSDRLARGINGV